MASQLKPVRKLGPTKLSTKLYEVAKADDARALRKRADVNMMEVEELFR